MYTNLTRLVDYFLIPQCYVQCCTSALLTVLTSCLSTLGGEISEMYKGTRAEDNPMPAPTATLPATMPHKLLAVAESKQPMKMGAAAKMRAFRRPKESARPLPVRLPTAAPARQLDTTCKYS